ncbi:MAG: hypothetical protein HQL54_01265 [Magnetococcales bacterium]|nr:hypothetical protein [Magnetococcales bacterium]
MGRIYNVFFGALVTTGVMCHNAEAFTLSDTQPTAGPFSVILFKVTANTGGFPSADTISYSATLTDVNGTNVDTVGTYDASLGGDASSPSGAFAYGTDDAGFGVITLNLHWMKVGSQYVIAETGDTVSLDVQSGTERYVTATPITYTKVGDLVTTQSYTDNPDQVFTLGAPSLAVATASQGQTAMAGSALTNAISVTLTDYAGNADNTTQVTFTPNTGSVGTVTGPTDGTSSAVWTLGETVGEQSLSISATGYSSQSVTATATVNPASVTGIAKTNDNQTATVGTALTSPFTITATDSSSDPVENVSVTFAVASGGGSLSETSVMTDSSGMASTTLTLGQTIGSNTVTASIANSNASDVTFTATGTPGAAATLDLSASASTVSSNSATDVTLTAILKDQYGNIVTTDDSTEITFATDAETYGALNATTATVSDGQTTNTLTSTINATGGNIVVTASATGLSDATVTVTTAPFSLDKDVVSLLAGQTTTLTLTGGTAPTWSTTGGTVDGNTTTATFTAPTTVTGSSQDFVVTVADTIGGASVSDTTAITVFPALTLAQGETSVADGGEVQGTAGTASSVTIGGGNTTTDTLSATVMAPGSDSAITCETDAICTITDSTLTLTPPTVGAFAGDYTVTITNDLGNDAETTASYSVSVPMTIMVDFKRFPESAVTGELDSSGNVVTNFVPTISVKGAADSDTITYTVLNSGGTEDTNGAIATIADATATSDGETDPTYVASSSVVAADVSVDTPFSVRVSNSTQTTLDAIDVTGFSILPTITYSGYVKSSGDTPTGIDSATVSLDNYKNAQGLPVSVITESDGSFSMTVPSRPSKYHTIVTNAEDYLPSSVSGQGYSGTSAGSDISLSDAGFKVLVTLPDLVVGSTVEVVGLDADDNVVAGPVNVTWVTEDTDAVVSLPVPADTTVQSIQVFADGYVSTTEDAGNTPWSTLSAVTINQTASLRFSVDEVVDAEATEPVTLTFTASRKIDSTDIDIDTASGYSVEAVDSSSNEVVPVSADPSGATFSTDQDMTVYLKSGDDVVFVYEYLSATSGTDAEQAAKEDYKTAQSSTAARSQARGSQTLAVGTGGTTSISGTTATFDTDADGNAITKSVSVKLPTNGIDTTALAGTLTGTQAVKSATLAVQTLAVDNTISARANGTGGTVVEVNLDVVLEDDDGVLDTVTDDVINTIDITIPYDTDVITDSSMLTDGTYAVLQYDSYDEFASDTATGGNRSDLHRGDDLEIDSYNGTITFTAEHLSVFTVSDSFSTNTSSSGGGGGFGPWALLALAPLTWLFRRFRK